jgi:hypothetical protein
VYQNGKITGFFRFKSPFGSFQTPENQAILSDPCIWFGKIEGLLIYPPFSERSLSWHKLSLQLNVKVFLHLLCGFIVQQDASAVLTGNDALMLANIQLPLGRDVAKAATAGIAVDRNHR